MGITIRQEVDIDISLEDLLEQVSIGDIMDELERGLPMSEIIDRLDTTSVLDSIAKDKGLDVILDNFPTRKIISELVDEHGVQYVQDYVNEHHAKREDPTLADKLEGESLEDVMKYLASKYQTCVLLSTLAIAMNEVASSGVPLFERDETVWLKKTQS